MISPMAAPRSPTESNRTTRRTTRSTGTTARSITRITTKFTTSHVDIGGTLQLAFKLAVAGATETVTVSDEPALVETQPAAISAVIDERAISELPLNGRRFTDLALLSAGAADSTDRRN